MRVDGRSADDILADHGAVTPEAIERVADEIERALPFYAGGSEFAKLVIDELRARATLLRHRDETKSPPSELDGHDP